MTVILFGVDSTESRVFYSGSGIFLRQFPDPIPDFATSHNPRFFLHLDMM